MYRMLSHGLSPCYIAKDLQRFGTCHALKHRFAQVRAAPLYKGCYFEYWHWSRAIFSLKLKR